jgi:hypothetical protein
VVKGGGGRGKYIIPPSVGYWHPATSRVEG